MIASIHELFKAFSGGQFEPVYTAQFESVWGSQFHLFLHKLCKTKLLISSESSLEFNSMTLSFLAKERKLARLRRVPFFALIILKSKLSTKYRLNQN
jgi:hypothetical protein